MTLTPCSAEHAGLAQVVVLRGYEGGPCGQGFRVTNREGRMGWVEDRGGRSLCMCAGLFVCVQVSLYLCKSLCGWVEDRGGSGDDDERDGLRFDVSESQQLIFQSPNSSVITVSNRQSKLMFQSPNSWG